MSEVLPNTPHNARRPLGLIVVVLLFFAFAVADVAALFAQGGMWWTVSLCMSVLLAFLFRKLWFGGERERQIGVFFGFFVVALDIFSLPDSPIPEWNASEYVGALEGAYAFCAAIYLMYVKRSPFFARHSVA